jgi:tetratricopeptide (TPR) repeat protein
MRRNRRTVRGRAALALGIACLAGCQHLNRPARRPGPAPGPREPGAKVTPAQVADVQIALGRAAEQRGDPDGAIAAYRDALARDRHRADAYWRLAILHDRRALFGESETLYRKALELDPKNPDIHCDRGYSLYLQRRWAEAEQGLRRAIALHPEHRRAHINLGLVLARDARPEQALEEFRRGGCGAAAAHNNLAFALTLDRRWDEARAQYRRALAADPASEPARTRLRELETLIARADGRPAAWDGQIRPASTAVAAPPRVAGAAAAGPRPDPRP